MRVLPFPIVELLPLSFLRVELVVHAFPLELEPEDEKRLERERGDGLPLSLFSLEFHELID